MHEVTAAESAAVAAIGIRFGWYQALAEKPMTAQQLADHAGVDVRFAEAWAVNQSGAGFVGKEGEAYCLNDEQRALFVDEGSHSVSAAFEFACGLVREAGNVEQAMASGGGVQHDAYDARTRSAMLRLDPARWQRVRGWIDAIGGAPRRIAEVGCGDGAMLLELARELGDAQFVGIEIDETALAQARAAARSQAMESRVEFRAALDAGSFDLILTIDTLHDVADPAALAANIAARLEPDGVWLVAEPVADNELLARLISATAMLYCIPTALAAGGRALGPLTGEEGYRTFLAEQGFMRVRRLEERTRCVLEARR